MKWPWKKEAIPSKPFTASIDGQPAIEGKLNIRSATWFFVRNYCHKRIMELREFNDNPNLADFETAALRGKIKAYKEIIALEDPEPMFRQGEQIFEDSY